MDNTIRRVPPGDTAWDGRVVSDGGLTAALESVISDARRTLGFLPLLRAEGPLAGVAPEVAVDLVAVLREALSNVARHAAASEVEVSLRVGPPLTLRVRDDGVGLPTESGRRSGLANLAERAAAHGGHCTVSLGHHGGTTLIWEVPRSPASVRT